MTVTGHYWSRNVHAVSEWATAWLNAHQDRYHIDRDRNPGYPEAVGDDPDAQAVIDAEEWCSWWIDNDPRDSGDPYERRNGDARRGWRETYRTYRRLTA